MDRLPHNRKCWRKHNAFFFLTFFFHFELFLHSADTINETDKPRVAQPDFLHQKVKNFCLKNVLIG